MFVFEVGSRTHVFLARMAGVELDSSLTTWFVPTHRYLCSRLEFEQGDFVDDAGLGSSSGFGTDSGLVSGRHIRSNYDNYTQVSSSKYSQK